MKKVNLTGKLSLKKETIAKLNNEQMNGVKGGTHTATGCMQCPTNNCGTIATCPSVIVSCSPTENGQCGGTTN